MQKGRVSIHFTVTCDSSICPHYSHHDLPAMLTLRNMKNRTTAAPGRVSLKEALTGGEEGGKQDGKGQKNMKSDRKINPAIILRKDEQYFTVIVSTAVCTSRKEMTVSLNCNRMTSPSPEQLCFALCFGINA